VFIFVFKINEEREKETMLIGGGGWLMPILKQDGVFVLFKETSGR